MKSPYKINKWLIIILLAISFTNAQDKNSQSVAILKIKLQKATADTTKINILNKIGSDTKYSNAKEGLLYSDTALALAQEIKWNKGISEAYENLGISNLTLSNYTEALVNLQSKREIDLRDKQIEIQKLKINNE